MTNIPADAFVNGLETEAIPETETVATKWVPTHVPYPPANKAVADSRFEMSQAFQAFIYRPGPRNTYRMVQAMAAYSKAADDAYNFWRTECTDQLHQSRLKEKGYATE